MDSGHPSQKGKILGAKRPQLAGAAVGFGLTDA